MLQEPCLLQDGPLGREALPPRPVFPSTLQREMLSRKSGFERWSRKQESPFRAPCTIRGPRGLWESFAEEVWAPFWTQSADVCVCFGGCGRQRGDGQDTIALNKVLCESQSHIPLNSEKLHKPTEEEGTSRERLRDLWGVVV